MKRIAAFLPIFLVFFSYEGIAQSHATENILSLDDGASPPEATIEDIAWLTGSWTGELLGGTFYEVWTSPSAGTMMGSFKLVRGDTVSFYELMTIREINGSLEINLKHFHDDLRGWEPQDKAIVWPLLKTEDKRVYFDGLTFEKTDDNHLTVYLAMKFGDKPVEEHQIVYNRTPL